MSQHYEHSTWQSCFRELAPKLLLYARQWLPTVADAEDVVQTAFVRFWKKHPGATRENYPLLYTAVRTASLDLLRGEERRARRENEPEVGLPVEGTPTFDPMPGDGDMAAQLHSALRSLPGEQREVIVLKIWSDLTFQEIADTTGSPLNTVAARYRYGLSKLRNQLEPHQFTP